MDRFLQKLLICLHVVSEGFARLVVSHKCQVFSISSVCFKTFSLCKASDFTTAEGHPQTYSALPVTVAMSGQVHGVSTRTPTTSADISYKYIVLSIMNIAILHFVLSFPFPLFVPVRLTSTSHSLPVSLFRQSWHSQPTISKQQ